MSSSNVQVANVRAWFPALTDDFAYLENAGGSQVPGVVAEAMRHYLTTSYVQVGATYPQSRRATEVVADAHAFARTFMNSDAVGDVAITPSTTSALNLLANAYAPTIRPGDEIVIANSNHESNAGPWERLGAFGAVVKLWNVDAATTELRVQDLEPLLTSRTRIVALPHVSNLLGDAIDLTSVVERAHAVGARVVADGVAYAPHRPMDVAAWGVDWYVYSAYKVFGPHVAAMFGRHDAFAEVRGPNHFFIEGAAHQFENGCLSHEACAGLLALRPYLRFLAGSEADDRATVDRAYATIRELERPVVTRLLDFLNQRPGVRVVGLGDPDRCVGVISFVSDRARPTEVVAATDRANIGIRNGHMYAYRLVRDLGIDLVEGVVRVSVTHYNTRSEIDRLIEVLDGVL